MQLQPNEQILFQARPRNFIYSGLYIILMPFIFHFIRIFKNDPLNSFNWMIAGFTFTIGIIMCQTVFQITSHRITLGFWKLKFLHVEKQHLISPISLQVPLKAKMQASIRRRVKGKKINDDLEYWQQRGQLFFPHQQKNTLLNTTQKTFPLAPFSASQRDGLFQALKAYWDFDPTQIQLENREDQNAIRQSQDIGKVAIISLAIATILTVIAFFIVFSSYKGLHFAVESFYWIIPLIFLCFFILYPFVRAEQKSHPQIVTAICALILGASLYFLALQCNRAYSEMYSTTLTTKMTFIEMDKYQQTWKLDESLKEKTGLEHIYVAKKWDGYNANAEQGKTYSVTIQQGYFQDYFVDQNSFKNIKVAE